MAILEAFNCLKIILPTNYSLTHTHTHTHTHIYIYIYIYITKVDMHKTQLNQTLNRFHHNKSMPKGSLEKENSTCTWVYLSHLFFFFGAEFLMFLSEKKVNTTSVIAENDQWVNNSVWSGRRLARVSLLNCSLCAERKLITLIKAAVRFILTTEI